MLLVLGMAVLLVLVLVAGRASGSDVGSVAGRHARSGAGSNSGLARTSTPQLAPLGSRVRIGAYVDGMTATPQRLTSFEHLIGRDVDIASYYYGFGDVFPGATEKTLSDNGRRTVLLSWDMGPTRLRDWARGRYDAYLRTIAQAASTYPWPVFVRPWPEMNGDWQDFQPTRSGLKPFGGTYADFRAAWRHVVDYTRAHGATNLHWVFSPSADTYQGTTPVRRIWPGSRYVDVLGVDGFNWGDGGNYGGWKSFTSIFSRQYRTLTTLDGHAPVWICEFGSTESRPARGHRANARRSKATWLKQALTLRAMPRLQALVFFQADKERDWRVDSSPATLRVVRRYL